MVILVRNDPQEDCSTKGRQPQHNIVEVEEQPLEHGVGQRKILILESSADHKSEGVAISIRLNTVKFHRPSNNEEDANTPNTSYEDVSGEKPDQDTEPQGTEEKER